LPIKGTLKTLTFYTMLLRTISRVGLAFTIPTCLLCAYYTWANPTILLKSSTLCAGLLAILFYGVHKKWARVDDLMDEPKIKDIADFHKKRISRISQAILIFSATLGGMLWFIPEECDTENVLGIIVCSIYGFGFLVCLLVGLFFGMIVYEQLMDVYN
jgi:hypothetical protein